MRHTFLLRVLMLGGGVAALAGRRRRRRQLYDVVVFQCLLMLDEELQVVQDERPLVLACRLIHFLEYRHLCGFFIGARGGS